MATKKDFDCVAQMRKSRDRISRATTGMSPQEIIDYFEKRKQTPRNKRAKKNVPGGQKSKKETS